MRTNGKIFKFNIFRRLGDFTRTISFDDISLKQAMDKQDEMEYLIRNLEDYKPKNSEQIQYRKEVLKNAKIFYRGRNFIVYAFEENIFPLSKEEIPQLEEWTEEEKRKYFLQKKDQELLLVRKRV